MPDPHIHDRADVRFCLDILTRATLEIRSVLDTKEATDAEINDIEGLCHQLQSLTARSGTDFSVTLAASSEKQQKGTVTSVTWEENDHIARAGADEARFASATCHDDMLEESPFRKDLVEIFREIDTDGSGKITTRELSKAMQAVGIPRARSAKLIRLADKDGSHEIDFNEWLNVVESCRDQEFEHFSKRLSQHKSSKGLLFEEEAPLRCMLHPFSAPRLSWDLGIILICCYLAITQPFYVAFEAKLPARAVDNLANVDRVLDIIFAVDILINFRTGYIIRGTKLTDTKVEMGWKRVALHYTRTWLLLDVLSAFPFSLILPGAVTDIQATKLLKAAKFSRLFKLVKTLPIFEQLLQQDWLEEMHSVAWIRFLRQRGSILWVMLLLCHVMSCIMKLIDDGFLTQGMPHESIQREYTAAFYWCMTTITTVGYGDITPTSDSERVFAVIAMVVGGIFYGIVVGSISSIVTEQDLNTSAFHNRMDRIYAWTVHHKLPRQARVEVCRYFRHFLKHRSAIDEAEVWEELTPDLQQELGNYIVHEDVRYNPLFDHISLSAVVKLQSILIAFSVRAGGGIVRCSDAGAIMYIISSGLVKQKFDKTATKIRLLQPGESFGEEVLLGLVEEYEYSTTAVEDTVLETILQDQFLRLFQAMPQVLQRIRQNALQLETRKRQQQTQYV
eukprot:TRINITY_DN3286_c1_g1_i3.p1 TRINITY_DN3286_c1_g1~~TRINITY_DN3286_c1_g1_i3.p1  ORF type:complete len:675 (+),score=117.63 TRINITY_DN3286_c1_g1_i3:124-2148(+)